MELTVDQMLQQGVAAHNAGNLQEAERLYRTILQVQPKHPDANHNLGLIAVSMNQSGVALPLFKSAIDVNPNIEQFWLSYIEALITERQFKNAKQAIKKGKKKGVAKEKLKALTKKLASVKAGNNPIQAPSQVEIQKLINHYQNGQYGDAETLAISITEQFPEHQFGWKALGIILGQAGRLSESLVANQKFVELAPQDTEAHNNLGNTLKELGRLVEAEVSYRQAVAMKPDYAPAHNNMGITLKELGRLEEAEASLRQAIALNADYVEAHNNLGITLNELGRLEEAEASYGQAIALKPDYALAHSNLGNTLKELGRLEEAEASYGQAIALKPDYALAHSNLGNTLKELGRLEEAEASWRQAIALKPDYAEAHYNLGNMLQVLGRLGEAEASYRQTTVLKHDYAEAHNNLGVTLQDLDRYEEAEASYKQAIALKSDYPDPHYNLGNILRQLGRLEQAEASLGQAIVLKPDYVEAKHMLSALTGETPKAPPRIYVENLFDHYASKFDTTLVDNLEYKAPIIIAEMIMRNHNDGSLGSVLDLGCGTGLVGVEIKQFCAYLEGIDLSNKMLEKARRKNIYDKLTHRDILDYLATESLDFDYFISTDVFIYLGDLSTVFQLIKSRNKSGGKLVFSTENTDKDGFFLEQSGRYSHSKQYIESLCEKFNYKLCHFENLNLRKEKNLYISGGLYSLDF